MSALRLNQRQDRIIEMPVHSGATTYLAVRSSWIEMSPDKPAALCLFCDPIRARIPEPELVLALQIY
jgi:hypothetical protein